MTPDGIVALCRSRAEATPERPLYCFYSRHAAPAEATHAQVDEGASAIAARLQQGHAPGARVLLVVDSSRDFVLGFLGALYAGMVPVPVVPPRAAGAMGNIERVALDSGASALLMSSSIQSTRESALADAPFRTMDRATLADALTFTGRWTPPNSRSSDVALLQYTSGSTGEPRGVVVRHGNLLANLEAIHRKFGNSERSRGVSWLPPYHDMGLVGGILSPLYSGFPMLLMPALAFAHRPLEWLRMISDFRATVSGGPTFAYQLCVQRSRFTQEMAVDLSTWSVAFIGAEPVRPDVLRAFSERFAAARFRPSSFYPCYGMAESTLFVSGGTVGDGARTFRFRRDALELGRVEPVETAGEQAIELTGCGASTTAGDIAIVEPQTGARCPAGSVGEIWLSGASIAAGYWQQEQLTTETFGAAIEGETGAKFLRTGDLGCLVDGELIVTGRMKDVIIIRGRNYYPEDIETTVARCVADLAFGRTVVFTIGADDDELVVVQEARAEPSGEEPVLETRIREAVGVEHNLEVRHLVLVEPRAVPLTSSGKVRRRATRQLFLDGLFVERTRSRGSERLNLQPAGLR